MSKDKDEVEASGRENPSLTGDSRVFTDWQRPLCEWLRPISEWQGPLAVWQKPLLEWSVFQNITPALTLKCCSGMFHMETIIQIPRRRVKTEENTDQV